MFRFNRTIIRPNKKHSIGIFSECLHCWFPYSLQLYLHYRSFCFCQPMYLKIKKVIKLLSVCRIEIFECITGCGLMALFIVAANVIIFGHILGCRDLLASIFNHYMKAMFQVMCHMLIRFMAIVTSQLFLSFYFLQKT